MNYKEEISLASFLLFLNVMYSLDLFNCLSFLLNLFCDLYMGGFITYLIHFVRSNPTRCVTTISNPLRSFRSICGLDKVYVSTSY
jgi:hypothetical protein